MGTVNGIACDKLKSFCTDAAYDGVWLNKENIQNYDTYRTMRILQRYCVSAIGFIT